MKLHLCIFIMFEVHLEGGCAAKAWAVIWRLPALESWTTALAGRVGIPK